jgi:4-hydroxyphenylpyruvate dioxygenase-like putative hemolysin
VASVGAETLPRRIDHPIVCVRHRSEWVPRLDRVLALSPRRQREGDEWGFSNAELDIGDGFLGVVEPVGATSQLHRFLESHGEGFYALSIDVGDLGQAAQFLRDRDVPFREAHRDGAVALLWIPPRATGGVLFQVTSGIDPHPGTNPLYRGVSEATIAVEDLDTAVATYQRALGFASPTEVTDGRLGYRGAALVMPASGDRLVLAESTDDAKPLGHHVVTHGPGIFGFTIDVTDLAAELARLSAAGVTAHVEESDGHPTRAEIDPGALAGLRVSLRPVP